jgi:hypothetical protein
MATDVNDEIDELINRAAYAMDISAKKALFFPITRNLIKYSAGLLPEYANVINHWPVALNDARELEELPYLPVAVFKRNPPLALVPAEQFQRVLLSSSTTGQTPSRIAVDKITAKRMTKGVVSILKDFIGSERRPYCVIDSAIVNSSVSELAARGAAIRGLSPFASSTEYCCDLDAEGNLVLNENTVNDFAKSHKGQNVLLYGFTSLLWKHLIEPFYDRNISLSLTNAFVLHSGGWKKMVEAAVSKDTFIEKTAAVVGCPKENIIDFYGMVENLGVIYPDCRFGNKHAPVFGEVLIRNPLSLKPVKINETGIVQVCSILPSSFPGHLLLTEDMGKVIMYDGCPCGRSGIAFRFEGRIPKTEIRGCGNIDKKLITLM